MLKEILVHFQINSKGTHEHAGDIITHKQHVKQVLQSFKIGNIKPIGKKIDFYLLCEEIVLEKEGDGGIKMTVLNPYIKSGLRDLRLTLETCVFKSDKKSFGMTVFGASFVDLPTSIRKAVLAGITSENMGKLFEEAEILAYSYFNIFVSEGKQPMLKPGIVGNLIDYLSE